MSDNSLYFRETYGFNFAHVCSECEFLKNNSCSKMPIDDRECPKKGIACFLFASDTDSEKK